MDRTNPARNRFLFGLCLTAALGAPVALTGCGGVTASKADESEPASEEMYSKYYRGMPAPDDQKRGGKLTVLAGSTLSSADPGRQFAMYDNILTLATHRTLYKPAVADPSRVLPDIAAGDPEVSDDGRKVTVKLRPGIKYSQPKGRTVKSDDIKYAIERGMKDSVSNGYADTYFGWIRGLKGSRGEGIPGIKTPDDLTVVFQLTEPMGATFVRALVMPLTAPVPREYATELDRGDISVYSQDPTKQAFTGPYVISKFEAGRRIILERNPNWDGKATSDPRPAYVDEIVWNEGQDNNVMGQRIATAKNTITLDLSGGKFVTMFTQKHPQQIVFPPSHGITYNPINTQLAPTSNVNFRRAINAIYDYAKDRNQGGGVLVSQRATHILSPGMPGFAEAGGLKGFNFDFLDHMSGNLAVATKYMKAAGYKNGRYHGKPLNVVWYQESPGPERAQILQESAAKIGIKMNITYRKYSHLFAECGNTKKMMEIHICGENGWGADFADGWSMFAATFAGNAIRPINNTNYSLLADKEIDAALGRAGRENDQDKRLKAFAEVDRQVTSAAPVLFRGWSRVPLYQGPGVTGVVNLASGSWDLSYTSVTP